MSGDCSATSCQQCRNRHCFDVHIVKALPLDRHIHSSENSSIEVAISGPIPCPGNNIAFIIVLLWIRGEGSLTSMQRCCQGFVVGRRWTQLQAVTQKWKCLCSWVLLQYHTQVFCCTWCLTWTHNHSHCTTATAYDSFSLLRLPYFCSVWFRLPPKIALVLLLFVECCAVFSKWSRESGIGIPSTVINRVCTQTCKGCRMCFWGQTLKIAECDWRWKFWVKEKALPSHRAAHHNDTMKDVESSMPISNRW